MSLIGLGFVVDDRAFVIRSVWENLVMTTTLHADLFSIRTLHQPRISLFSLACVNLDFSFMKFSYYTL